MRLAVNLEYLAPGNRAADVVALAERAEALGYAVAWVAEAFSSDAPSVLGYLAARTERLGLGAAVMQIPARSPAATAMTAATIDTLSGGRFHLGLGVSGPQVSEGLHGVRFGAPLARTREYVEVVRRGLRGERVTGDGPHFPLPLPDSAGKALRLGIRPPSRVPVYLAAMGPAMLRCSGEVADGWLAMFFSPAHAASSLATIAEGRRWAGVTMADFDVVATMGVALDDDVSRAADTLRERTGFYLGAMGSRQANFYVDQAARMGFGEQAAVVQQRYLAGDKAGALTAVPAEFIDATALIGPVSRIAERIEECAEAGVTTLAVRPSGADLTERLAALQGVAAAFERARTRQ